MPANINANINNGYCQPFIFSPSHIFLIGINAYKIAQDFNLWEDELTSKVVGKFVATTFSDKDIVFVVYDISSKTTFNNVPSWISFIKSIENTTIILCGNKTDLTSREVQTSEGEQFAQKEGIPFFEVCAKTNENIKFMFYKAVADLPHVVFILCNESHCFFLQNLRRVVSFIFQKCQCCLNFLGGIVLPTFFHVFWLIRLRCFEEIVAVCPQILYKHGTLFNQVAYLHYIIH